MQSDPQPSTRRRDLLRRTLDAGGRLFRTSHLNLPGQLLALIVALAIVALVLVYFPAAAAYRLQWMEDRAEAAHLAALAADVAEDSGALGERTVEELLAGADAVAVSRVRNGINELILYGGPINAEVVISDLREASWWDHIRETVDALYAPDGRMLRIRAEPDGRPNEVIDVILSEEPFNLGPQLVRRHLGRVYQMVGAVPHDIQQLHLTLDAGFQHPVDGHRMASPRLRISLHQHIPATLQKQKINLDLACFHHAIQCGYQRIYRKVAGPDIHTDCNRWHRPGIVEQSIKQPQGDVVDGLKAHVFKGIDRGRTTGPGCTGHDNGAHLGINFAHCRPLLLSDMP